MAFHAPGQGRSMPESGCRVSAALALNQLHWHSTGLSLSVSAAAAGSPRGCVKGAVALEV